MGDSFVIVKKVFVTPDISMAKIYLSVYNREDKQAIIDKVSENAFKLKKNLAHRIKRHVRRIPNIAFYNDDTLDEMYHINDIFKDLEKERQSKSEEQ